MTCCLSKGERSGSVQEIPKRFAINFFSSFFLQNRDVSQANGFLEHLLYLHLAWIGVDIFTVLCLSTTITNNRHSIDKVCFTSWNRERCCRHYALRTMTAIGCISTSELKKQNCVHVAYCDVTRIRK